MSRTLRIALTAAICLPLALASSASALKFQAVGTLDVSVGGLATPGSVASIAAYGDTIYIGGLFAGGAITKIDDPFGTPVVTPVGPSATLGGSTNGFVSLSTDGTTVVAATNNGGADGDIVESYNFATGALNFSTDSDTLNAPIADGPGTGDRFDGAAVDPISGNVYLTAFGSGNPAILDPVTGAPVPGATPSSLFTGGTATGFRDVSFNSDGDIFVRAVGGIARGNRNGPDDYTQPDGGGAGVDAIVLFSDGFNSAINVESIPASVAGQELVIANFRNAPSNAFSDTVLLFDGDPTGGSQALADALSIPFLNADGTPFAPSVGDIYDFSFDPVNNWLYVGAHSSGIITAFAVIPEPSTAVLAVAFAGLGLVRRRG